MNLTPAKLMHNTLIALDGAQRDLPKYRHEVAQMQRDMYSQLTPNTKLCLLIQQGIEQMYEGRYEVTK